MTIALHVPDDELDRLIERLQDHRKEQFFLEEQFRSAFYNTSRAMCVVSLKGYFIEVNEAATRLFLRSREELLSLKWQDLTPDADRAEDETHIQNSLQGRAESSEMYKRYYLPDGELIRCHLEVTIVKDSLGYPKLFISRIYSERTLKNMLLKLQEKAI